MSVVAPRRRLHGGRRAGDNLTAYLMITPMVILLALFFIGPVLYSFYLSGFEISFYKDPVFVGFQFYRYVLEDPRFWNSLRVGLTFGAIVVPAGLILALLYSTFIKSLGRHRGGYMKTLIYVPTVVSPVVAALIFVFMYQDKGVVNWATSLVGIEPIAWLIEPNTALISVAVPFIWLQLGLNTLIMLAGLLDIPDSYYESAQLDGAGYFHRLWYITIPMLKNILLYLFITGFVAAVQVLELPLVMTRGGPNNVTTAPNLFIFNTFRDATPYSTSFSLTAALLLFLVLGAISALVFRLIKSEKAVDG